ncbi:NAD-dependent epimerase/dehydratase [Mesorhizobium plurifarium]|uniref:NAD-dependent epimerase/dehydratase n=1 Tax=Mesorhizobium plurifarium TaxID=69974 RepID=A0A090FWP8_MESPL|nr:NAD-dependent epimerase/dehydratase [Mesorhizobium plurifarium]
MEHSLQSSFVSGKVCAVIGAGGFLGTNLCLRLSELGARVRAIGRRARFPRALEKIEWRQGDISDQSVLSNSLFDVDIVFHLANSSTPHSSNINKIVDVKNNLITTLNILDQCKELGVRKVIFSSSGGTVYGIPETLPMTEDHPERPISSYGINKLSSEKYFSLYERLHKIDYRIARLANPFGPYQTAEKNQGVIAAFAKKMLLDEPIHIWGDGNVVRDFLYVSDAVEAMILLAAHTGDDRVFNVGSGIGRSLKDVLQALETSMGKKPRVEYGPGRIDDSPAVVLDITRARASLRWQPQVEFQEGVGRTVVWLKNNLKIDAW